MLKLADIDLVANDTGGAIAQVFAAGHPQRLHTLTLTNCEAHNNLPPKALPPKALLPAVLLARAGLPVWRLAPRPARDIPRGRKRLYGGGYQNLASLPEEIARARLDLVVGTAESARQFQRLMTSLRARDLLAAEPASPTPPHFTANSPPEHQSRARESMRFAAPARGEQGGVL